MALLLLCTPLSVSAAGTGWVYGGSKTWNPGAVSVTYRAKGYFISGLYDYGGQINVTGYSGSYTKSSDTVYDYDSYIKVSCYFYSSNNSHHASETVAP